MSLTATKAAAYLHHIHLCSPDPQRLAAFYAATMEMESVRRDGVFLLSGPSRRLIVSEGPANRLGHGAFACRDGEGLDELKAAAQARRTRRAPSRPPRYTEKGPMNIRLALKAVPSHEASSKPRWR